MDLPFRAEYAKSRNSRCKGCNTLIAKDTLRLAVIRQGFTFDKRFARWYHVPCFFDTQLVKSVGDISNFESLRSADQQLILSKVAGEPSGSTSGRVSNGVSAGGIEDIEEQNEMIFRYRDHLKLLQRKHLTDLLEHNNQETIAAREGIETIHDRLADAMTFGALLPCEECGHSQIVFRSGVGYLCLGNKDAWVKCETVTDDPKRKPFLVPDHLKDSPFLASYKYKPQKRILQYNKPTDSNPLTFSGGKYESNLPSKVKLKVQNGVAVDPASGLEDVAHVYRFRKHIYSAVLSRVDLQSGCNSYYKLQVLESNDKKMYWLFRAWGRVGTHIGKPLLKIKASKEDAIGDFEKIFEKKTANKWRNRANFVKVADKKNWVDVSYEYVKSAVPSKLQQPVHNLIALIFNEDTMKNIMLEFELDTETMPLGKLSKEQIRKAFNVLNELQKYISTSGDRKTTNWKILALTNQFYTLIPHSVGVDNPPLLDHLDTIKQKYEMLRALMGMEIAYSIRKDVKSEKNDVDPIDSYYLKLKTCISPLNRTDREFQRIQLYVENSHAETQSDYNLEIVEIYTVERRGERKRYEPFKKLHNRKLLWHGSRLPNFAGILSQGLRIAPPKALKTGYRNWFGNGIYFADRVSKSANFCYSKNTNNTGLVLLCQVALGDMHELERKKKLSKPPAGKHSVLGLGLREPDPSQSFVRKDGVEIPLGKEILINDPGRWLDYNEYVVYDAAQVKVEYLVQLKFNYK
ncbi:poly [ADP-ribose] polymerase-like [Planococcus citri]|uniref:poly [ADP-ribose] polymerase-like n=1 Tax=Planococcus citri TaxID=170843 RepID=UPI0031F980E3